MQLATTTWIESHSTRSHTSRAFTFGSTRLTAKHIHVTLRFWVERSGTNNWSNKSQKKSSKEKKELVAFNVCLLHELLQSHEREEELCERILRRLWVSWRIGNLCSVQKFRFYVSARMRVSGVLQSKYVYNHIRSFSTIHIHTFGMRENQKEQNKYYYHRIEHHIQRTHFEVSCHFISCRVPLLPSFYPTM